MNTQIEPALVEQLYDALKAMLQPYPLGSTVTDKNPFGQSTVTLPGGRKVDRWENARQALAAADEALHRRKFPVDVVLTLTTGAMLCNKTTDLIDLMSWLSRDEIGPAAMTIPSVSDLLRKEAIRQHPELAQFGGAEITADNAEAWLDKTVEQLGVLSMTFTRGPLALTKHDEWNAL